MYIRKRTSEIEYVRSPREIFTAPDSDAVEHAGQDLHGLLAELAHMDLGPFSRALKRGLDGLSDDVVISTGRGKSMVSVSESATLDFERDSDFKSYSDHNHMFADLLVPLDALVKEPVIFWLYSDNPVGASVTRIEDPGVFVISLGRPYSFAEVCICINYALAQQGVRVENPWFGNVIRQHGLDPSGPAFSCLVGADPADPADPAGPAGWV